MNEPTCPTCGNNRQVWTNQISGEKVCHRAGCHATISPAPHPLAVEAAEILDNHAQIPVLKREQIKLIQDIIHTTAVEPVIAKAELMVAEISALIGYCQSSETCRPG